MQETPDQYAARISSYVAGKNFLQAIKKSPDRIAALLKGKTPARLKKRPSETNWSAAEIIAHLTEAEIAFSYRIRLIAGAPGTPVQAFNQDHWQVNAGYLKKNPKDALSYYRAMRAMNVAFLSSHPPEVLERFGMHAERGQESIRRLMELMAGHDENHIRQLEALVKKVKGPTTLLRSGASSDK